MIDFSKQFLFRCLILSLITTSTSIQAANDEEHKEKTIFGWIEYIELQSHGFKTKAKLDTGAKTSSIHAENIEWFTKNDEDWVRFDFSDDIDDKDTDKTKRRTVTIEAPIERSALIKQHKRSSAKRAVVRLPFSLAGENYDAEFTLTDRGKFLYQVLLGRRFLKDVALVDPGNTFLKTSTKTTEIEMAPKEDNK